jgi:hypothetical protein
MGTAQIQISLNLRSGNLQYQNVPNAFNAVVAGANGPTPGSLLIATTPGTDVNLSELSAVGGFCVLANLDSTNWVEYGIYDAGSSLFFPLGEILAGEQYILRLSRNLGKDYPGSGTGVPIGATLRIVANTASCRVFVGAFDP